MQIFLGLFNSQQKLATLYFQGNLLPCLADLQEISNILVLVIASIKFRYQGTAVCCYETSILQERTKKWYKFTKIMKG